MNGALLWMNNEAEHRNVQTFAIQNIYTNIYKFESNCLLSFQ